MKEITVVELKQALDAGQTAVILDVREPHELKIAALPATDKTLHIPLGQLPSRLNELSDYKDSEIIVYCRSGGRSAMAVGLLMQSGFKTVVNLKGGVLAWASQIDPNVPTY